MDKKQIISSFASPSVEYRGKPFWSWNGELRGEELVRQAHVMKEMGLGGYFMHSRAGLITEYLGDEWFDLINEVADAAEEDGMEAWLYDEDRWPSGSAGGKVTVDPQYRMKSLYVYESAPDKVDWNDESIALYAAKLDGINLYTYKELDTASIRISPVMTETVNRLSGSRVVDGVRISVAYTKEAGSIHLTVTLSEDADVALTRCGEAYPLAAGENHFVF